MPTMRRLPSCAAQLRTGLVAAAGYALALAVATAALPSTVQAQVLKCTNPQSGEVSYTDGKCPQSTRPQEIQPPQSPQELAQQQARTQAALQAKQDQLAAEALQAQRDAALAQKKAATTPPTVSTDYATSPACLRAQTVVNSLHQDDSARATQDFLQAAESAQRQMERACLSPERWAQLEMARASQPRTITAPPTQQPWPYVAPGYGYLPPGTPAYGYPTPPSKPVFPAPATTRPSRLVQCTDYHCTDNQGQRYPKYGKDRFPGNGGVCRSVGGQAPC